MIPFVDVLYAATGVGGCGWPISSSYVLTDVAFWKVSHNFPKYASVADTMIFFIMLHFKYTGIFSGGIACIGVLNVGPRKEFSPDLLCASGSDR